MKTNRSASIISIHCLALQYNELLMRKQRAACVIWSYVWSWCGLTYRATFTQDALHKSSFESYSGRARDSLSCWTPDCIGFNLIEAVLCHICRKERQGAVLVFMTGWEDISSLRDQLKAHPLLGDPNRVLLLTCHGSMGTSEQVSLFLYLLFRIGSCISITHEAFDVVFEGHYCP